MTTAQKVMRMANKEGLETIQEWLLGFMSEEEKQKFLGFNRWHFQKCSDGSRYSIRVNNKRIDCIELH